MSEVRVEPFATWERAQKWIAGRAYALIAAWCSYLIAAADALLSDASAGEKARRLLAARTIISDFLREVEGAVDLDELFDRLRSIYERERARARHDPEKLKTTVARLERIVKALSESAVIRAAYGEELESLKRGLLKVKGFVDLYEFLAQREPPQLGEAAGAEHAKAVLEIARALRRTAQECNRLADELEKTVALHA